MVLEGEPPIGSGEIDAIQYQMLRNCDITGLLTLETEEMDGSASLRYSLSGRRMLSHALRSIRWSMADALTALCRLADVMEMGREYMLDLERYILDDDYIFVGEGWHDLAFTYLPLWRQTASASVASGIEKLIVRWMMNVDTPDGIAMQQLLRLASSPDFSPAKLREYARQYLTGTVFSSRTDSQSGRTGEPAGTTQAAAGVHAGPLAPKREEAFSPAPSAPEWEAGELAASRERSGISETRESKSSWSFGLRGHGGEQASQGLSGWLGEERLWDGEEDKTGSSVTSSEASSRRRIWLLAGAAAMTAAVWRFAYLPHPSSRGLLLSFGLTFLAAGACFLLWDGKLARKDRSFRRQTGQSSSAIDDKPQWPQQSKPDPDEEARAETASAAIPELASPERRPRRFGGGPASPSAAWQSSLVYDRTEPRDDEPEAGTSWLDASMNGTRLLSGAEETATPQRRYYLEWDSEGGKRRIPLTGVSLVIGRSPEAAQHIDDTEGVSRAHLEILSGDAAWQARDLGSRNGSWLNGVPMAPYEIYPLNKGDSIQVASSLYRYGEA
nr:FHA domain-containing protein [Cohnella lubricantis]